MAELEALRRLVQLIRAVEENTKVLREIHGFLQSQAPRKIAVVKDDSLLEALVKGGEYPLDRQG